MANASNADEPLPIIVIGGGSHARVLLDTLALLGRRVLFITDSDPANHGKMLLGTRVCGADDAILTFAPDQVGLVNAVGSVSRPLARQKVYEQFSSRGYHFESIVHPSAVVAASARLDEGVQVMAGVVIETMAHIKANVLVNTSASVNHDCVIGAHSHLAPGVTLSGAVHIDPTVHVGTGANVIQGIHVGEAAIIGAGAVVIRDVKPGACVCGVPARSLATAPDDGARTDPGVVSQRRLELQPAKPFNIMISAAGRRVALLRILQDALVQLDAPGRVVATDITPLSATCQIDPHPCFVPRYAKPGCLDKLLELCQNQGIRLIVPTIDPDLRFYAQHHEAFEATGTRIAMSSPQTIEISEDKQLTHDWLVEHGFPAIPHAPAERLQRDLGDWRFPLFIKPRRGSSSTGAGVLHNPEELAGLTHPEQYIIQPLMTGQEYTIDVYVDPQGQCRCAVPRARLEVRGGEVSKAMTVRHPPLEALAKKIAQALPGALGVLNIQMFHDPQTDRTAVVEINARFGGGYPLTEQAGATMARWLIEDMLGLDSTARDDQWQDGLVMLRYDDAVFVTREQLGSAAPFDADAIPKRGR